MRVQERDTGLKLLDELVAEGQLQFTARQASARTARSPTSTSNLLRRLLQEGLVDRVRRGRYAIRPLGSLGTTVATESVLLAVAAGFPEAAHRVAYRSALDYRELLVHPSRSIQVALTRPTRSETLSGRPLITVLEPEATLLIGAERHGSRRRPRRLRRQAMRMYRIWRERSSTRLLDPSSSAVSRSSPRHCRLRPRRSIRSA